MEGGGEREEGREEECFLERRGRICRRRRRRENTGVACSKQRFWGSAHASVKQRGTKPLPDIKHTGEEYTLQGTDTNRHSCTQHMQKQTCNYMHNVSFPCRWIFEFRSWNIASVLQFPWRQTLKDSTVCPVCKMIPLFLSFLLLTLFSTLPVSLTAFL